MAPCRLCDRLDNGALELTDGTLLWPEGLAHYVLDHHVRLPQRVVDHVLWTEQRLEGVAVDAIWWGSQATRRA